jgi:threonyl-tRNA synthetase
MRVRQFTQDDAHIFCREDQIVEEVRAFCALADRIYKDFGFTYSIKLALRPEKRFGSDADVGQGRNRTARRGGRAGLATENMAGKNCPAKARSMRPSSNGT